MIKEKQFAASPQRTKQATTSGVQYGLRRQKGCIFFDKFFQGGL